MAKYGVDYSDGPLASKEAELTHYKKNIFRKISGWNLFWVNKISVGNLFWPNSVFLKKNLGKKNWVKKNLGQKMWVKFFLHKTSS